MSMKMSDVTDDGSVGAKARGMLAILVPLAGMIVWGGTLLWQTAGFHSETENHLVSVEEKLTDVRKDVGSIRDEQARVHDKLMVDENAAKSIADDVTASRARNLPRLDSLEKVTQIISQDLAVIKQGILDNKDATRELQKDIRAHSDDLAAIRSRMGVAPRDRAPMEP